jgi:hypothetical protein
MVFDKIFGFLVKGKRSDGLGIQFGTVNSILARKGYQISGHGPYMKTRDGGYHWKRARREMVLLPSKEPNPHILVSGMSGFGKSMFFKSVLVDVARAGVSCILFDGHNEHEPVVKGLGGATYDSRNGGINLLSLDGETVGNRTAALVSILGGVYRLGHIQSTKLGQCLRYTYRRFGARGSSDRVLQKEPTVGDLLFEISIFIRNATTATEKATLINLQSKISNLNTPAFNRSVADGSHLKSGIHSFSVAERMSKEARLIYLVELLERIYSGMKDDPKDGKVRQYIMIDESQVLINESEECSGIITKFIEEGRKYGRGVMIVTHMSSKLNRQIVANAATFMAFYSREPSEAAYVAKVMTSNFDAEQSVRSKASGLGDGEALVISANDRTPKVVSTLGLHGKVSIYKPVGGVGEPELPIKPMTAEQFCMKTGVKGDRLRELVSEGALESFYDGEREWVMRKRRALSTEHEVMVIKLHEIIRNSGMDAYIYDRAGGPDVVAYGKDGKVAIEYETGSKSLRDSALMIRSRKPEFAKVIVVVKEVDLERYSEALKGLDIPVLGSSDISALPAMI